MKTTCPFVSSCGQKSCSSKRLTRYSPEMAKYLLLATGCALFLILLTAHHVSSSAADNYVSSTPAWAYKCDSNRCVKVEANDKDIQDNLSLPVCRLFCGPQVGTLWPYPTGQVKVGDTLVRFDPQKITFDRSSEFAGEYTNLLSVIEKKREGKIHKAYPGSSVLVDFDVANVETPFSLDMDQSYTLKITKGSDEEVNVLITAQNAFGMRYALTTLSQLIVFDDFRREMLISADVLINDEPVFKHRGIVLDTSRNYFSVASIKRTIQAMSLSKLNIFHWHITDSHSFPLVVAKHPELHRLGAYRPEKIYTPEAIREIVEFARIRGVAVVPEFDAPAHVGEGWQKKDLTACFNAQPWEKFCVEPPCGQLDPTQDHLYDVLEDIYSTMWTAFEKPHLFHMGGDEVSVSCWNSSARIQQWMKHKGWKLEEKDFMRLWGHFQDNAMQRLDKVMGDAKKDRPIVLWTSRLTDVPYVNEYVDKKRTIIQIWTKGDDPKVVDLLKNGYRIIVSNYDALYLDCGFAGWVTDGNNWCAPFIGWQKIYDNRMEAVAGNGTFVKQVLGAEAALWSEQADEHTLDSRLWPRGSAMAERLWTNPPTEWRRAETRMLWHREELVNNGIAAEALQPEWCLENEGNCFI